MVFFGSKHHFKLFLIIYIFTICLTRQKFVEKIHSQLKLWAIVAD
jgi:hypothetical protein